MLCILDFMGKIQQKLPPKNRCAVTKTLVTCLRLKGLNKLPRYAGIITSHQRRHKHPYLNQSVSLDVSLNGGTPYLTPQVLLIFSRKTTPMGLLGFPPSILGWKPPKLQQQKCQGFQGFFRFRSAMGLR